MERKDKRDNRVTSTVSSPTEFVLHWPTDKKLSVWYFRTGAGERIYLKHGWNIFGRRSCSHIEIKEPLMKSTEFCVRVLGNSFLLVLYDISGNLLLNGKRLKGETTMLHSGARVGVIVHRKKVIFFEFRNK